MGRYLVTGAAGAVSNPYDGGLAELSYLPWLNTKFSLQYIAYSEFDGGGTYISGNTGTQRNAKDNNTLHLSAWFMF